MKYKLRPRWAVLTLAVLIYVSCSATNNGMPIKFISKAASTTSANEKNSISV